MTILEYIMLIVILLWSIKAHDIYEKQKTHWGQISIQQSELGHDWVIYKNGFSGSITHSPDCECLGKKR